jgi:hypothetical protein
MLIQRGAFTEISEHRHRARPTSAHVSPAHTGSGLPIFQASAYIYKTVVQVTGTIRVFERHESPPRVIRYEAKQSTRRMMLSIERSGGNLDLA